MKLTQEYGTATYRIRSYERGRIRINDELIEASVVVTPELLIRDWAPQRPDQLGVADLAPIIDFRPEVVLLGTGVQQRFPDRSVLRELLTRGIGVEVMDTGAACRTYNILMAEDRRVAAALILD